MLRYLLDTSDMYLRDLRDWVTSVEPTPLYVELLSPHFDLWNCKLWNNIRIRLPNAAIAIQNQCDNNPGPKMETESFFCFASELSNYNYQNINRNLFPGNALIGIAPDLKQLLHRRQGGGVGALIRTGLFGQRTRRGTTRT